MGTRRIIYQSVAENTMSNKEKTKVYVVGGAVGYANWLPNVEVIDSEKEADVIFFTGGSDVSPNLYGDKTHKTTSVNIERDLKEAEIGKRAIKAGKKILGVCRGAQFSCVLAGGKLIQHQQNLHLIHPIYTAEGLTVEITSTHHQAMYPFNLPTSRYTLLAWAKDHSQYHLNGLNKEMSPEREVEICYFSNINALGIQGHPEMMWGHRNDYSATFEYLHKIFNLFIKNKIDQNYK